MTLQNRVLPDGQVVAAPNRGTLMGNRGILHGADQTLGTARWRHKAWVCCLLSFKGRRRRIMAPNNYTELFFLDEATAFAAGHRPCAECRRADHLAFKTAWAAATGKRASAPEMDAVLHLNRVTRKRAQVTYQADASTLPNGTFIQIADGHAVLWGASALMYRPSGYYAAIDRPNGPVTVLTPRPTVTTIAHGYRPTLHFSASAYLS